MQGLISGMNVTTQNQTDANQTRTVPRQFYNSDAATVQPTANRKAQSRSNSQSSNQAKRTMDTQSGTDIQGEDGNICQIQQSGKRLRNLDYLEPVPPTRVHPAVLTKARLEYIQVGNLLLLV